MPVISVSNSRQRRLKLPLKWLKFRRVGRSRWPLAIALIFLLTVIPFVLLRGFRAPQAEAAWWNPSWQYRQSIPITNNTTQQSNVYISLTLDTSDTTKFQADCGDLRFTKQNGQLLPYHIVSGCGTASTSVHVQLDTFPAGAQTLYSYYGNPSAPDGFTNNDFLMEATNYSVGGTGSEETAPGPVSYWKFDEGSGAIAYDSAGHSPGQEVLIDGDMENEGTSVWMASTGDYESLLSKETANPHSGNQVLRITSVNDEVSWAYQQVLQSAMRYRITGYARSDGSAHPTLTTNGSSAVFWMGTTSTEWQYFDEIFEAQTNRIWLRKTRGGAGSYVDFDQVSVVPISDGNHGTITGATWANENQCVSGKCLSFDGVDDYVAVNDDSADSRSLTTSATIEIWAKSDRAFPGDSTSYNYRGLVDNTSGGDVPYISYSLHWYGNDSISNLRLTLGDETKIESDSYSIGALTPNQWYHFVVTWSSGTIQWYVNGQNVKTDTTSVVPKISDFPTYIGGHTFGTANSTRTWDGLIDEVKIFPYALTEDEIKAEYNLGAAVVIGAGPAAPPPAGGNLDDSLVAHWAFDEQYGQTAHDKVGGNDGTFGADANPGTDDPTWRLAGECKVNGCLGFETGDYIRTSLDVPLDHSVSFWMKPSSVLGTINLFSFQNLHYSARLSNGKILFTTSDDGYQYCTGNRSLNPGEAHHVLVSYESGTNSKKIYVDGMLDNACNQGNYVAGLTNRAFTIGGVNTSFNYSGLFDEFKIYNTALTPEQVLQDMNAGASLTVGMGANEADEIIDGAGAPPIAEWKFDEGEGGEVFDSSGNNKTLTLYGSPLPTWKQGKIGKGLLFSGENGQSASVTDSGTTSLDLNGNLTIEAWVYWNQFKNYGVILQKGAGGSSSSINYGLWSYTNSLNCTVGNGISTNMVSISSTTISTHQWHHISCTADGSIVRLYVDGKVVNLTTQNITPTANDTTFSVGNAYGKNYVIDGQIDHVKIYDYARTPAQIAYDYNRGEPVAHWRFDECEGTVVHDSSGNDNHGTINIGASGSQVAAGTCQTSGAWANGKDGKFGGSLNFDGTDDYVRLENSEALDFGTESFSFGGWMKFGDKRVVMPLSKSTSGYANPGYRMYVNSSSLMFLAIMDGVNRCEFSVDISPYDSKWTHYLGVWNATTRTCSLYIDGQQKHSLTRPAMGSISNTYHLTIGAAGSGSYSYQGFIDDVRIYNYALSPAQVRKIMNEGASVRYGE